MANSSRPMRLQLQRWVRKVAPLPTRVAPSPLTVLGLQADSASTGPLARAEIKSYLDSDRTLREVLGIPADGWRALQEALEADEGPELREGEFVHLYTHSVAGEEAAAVVLGLPEHDTASEVTHTASEATFVNASDGEDSDEPPEDQHAAADTPTDTNATTAVDHSAAAEAEAEAEALRAELARLQHEGVQQREAMQREAALEREKHGAQVAALEGKLLYRHPPCIVSQVAALEAELARLRQQALTASAAPIPDSTPPQSAASNPQPPPNDDTTAAALQSPTSPTFHNGVAELETMLAR